MTQIITTNGGGGGGSGGSGNVTGPNGAVDENIVIFDGNTGKVIKDSGVNLADKQDKLMAGTDLEIIEGTTQTKTASGTGEVEISDVALNGINSVTLTGGCVQTNLPEGYTQVEYLQSDGNQYIDTGRVPNMSDIIEQKFQRLVLDSGTNVWYGSMPSSSTVTPRVGLGSTSVGFFAGNNSTPFIRDSEDNTLKDTDIHTLKWWYPEANGVVHYILDNGTENTLSVTGNGLSPAVSLTSYLFARHGNNGVQATDGSGTRIFYHREYLANGTLVFDAIPCRRNSDNVLGMYESVSGTFLTNIGTGVFTTSGNATPTPDMPINIVSNNGVLKVINGQVGANDSVETVTDELGNTATAQTLLAIGNNKDTQEIISGAITRNVATLVLDGTENWIVNTQGTYPFFRVNSVLTYSGNITAGFYCTHFPTDSITGSSNAQGIRIYSNSIFLRWDDLYPASSANVTNLKTWLATQYANGTPVILVYPLENATTETTTAQTLTSIRGDNTIEITQSALSDLPISVSYVENKPAVINFTNDTGYITSSQVPTYTAGTGISINDYVISATGGGGNGDVTGPNSATNGHIAVFDGATGKLIKDGGAIDSEISTTSTNAIQSKAVKEYIVSRGENLVSNGFASLSDNYNFSALTFDGSDTYGAGGCFYIVNSASGRCYTDELMPVDITQSYRLSYAVKNTTETATYDFVDMFDIDGNRIAKGNADFTSGTTTTLTQELKNGDTVIHFADLSGWDDESTSQYLHALIFWNYKNSYGYQYPVEYYSRYWWYNLWSDSSTAIDKVNNTITLPSAWNHGTFPVGTSVSQGAPSGANVYGNSNYVPTPNTWTPKEFVFTPSMYRNGLAYIRLGWLTNYSNQANNRFSISSVSFTQNASMNDIAGKQNNWIDVTVTTAYNTAAKVGTTTSGNYTPTKGDFLLVNFVNGCSVSSPTLAIDGGAAKYIRTGNVNANTGTFALGSTANSNVKALMYYDGAYLRVWSTTNATYTAMSESEGKTATATTGRLMGAANLKTLIKYHAVDDTAYGSGWDGVTDTAPSKNAVYDKIESLNLPVISASAPATPTEGMIWYDTTNDKLKTYDGSNWNECGSGGGGGGDTPAVVFALEDTSDTTGAQDIVDFLMEDASYYVIINFWEDLGYYVLCEVSSTYADFLRVDIDGDKQYKIRINYNSGTHIVSTITAGYNTIGSVVSGDSGTTYTIKVSNTAPASGTPNTTITFVTD